MTFLTCNLLGVGGTLPLILQNVFSQTSLAVAFDSVGHDLPITALGICPSLADYYLKHFMKKVYSVLL